LRAIFEQTDQSPVYVAEAEEAQLAGADGEFLARMRTSRAPKGAPNDAALAARLKACPMRVFDS
jgi:hypothetical protein